MNKDFVLHCH